MNNVTIIDKNGNGILAEGVAYITLSSETASKNYVFYTLNEIVENGLTKIYIAEDVGEGPKDVKISDEEWADIKKTMVSILHAEALPNVTFNKMDGKTFNISEPKKLAIDLVKKQTLIDAQNTNVLASAQAVPANEPAASGGFFNAEVAGTNEPEKTQVTEAIPNIFENPMQPEVATANPVAVNELPSEPVLTGITDPTQVPINNTINNAVTVDQVPEKNVQVEEVQNMNQTLVNSIGDVSAMPEENMAAPINNSKPSMEEVKQALDILNRYFSDTQDVLTPSSVIAQTELIPQAVESTPIVEPTPVVEVPSAPEVTPVAPEVQPVTPVAAPEAVNSVPEITTPEFVPVSPQLAQVAPEPVVAQAPQAAPTIIPVTPALEALQAAEANAAAMPQAPATPAAPVSAIPQTPGIDANPVQMPSNGAQPISNAGFEGMTVDGQ